MMALAGVLAGGLVARSAPPALRCARHAGVRALSSDRGASTIFDKILAGDIPAKVVHDDAVCLGFEDVAPTAPVHLLLIPKERAGLTQIRRAQSDNEPALGHMMRVAGELGKQHCPDGFRLVVNDGEQGCQSVYHLHIHIIGGRQMSWPPG
jgi:histidine triad (HIT) family protein